MGIIDFVKGGVQRMMIARPDSEKSKVIYKHPDQNFPFWSQLTVDSDEVALFFKNGSYVGLLSNQGSPHALQTQNIPFLNALVDKFTGGNIFISELYFVTTRPIFNEGFGDSIGSMRDPELDLRVTPRAFGTYSFQVVDPIRFVLGFMGQGGADPNRTLAWVRDMLFMGLRTTLTRLIKSGDLSLMDLGTCGPDVARAVVNDCPDLANIGVKVLQIAKLNINLSEEDQGRIDEKQDQIVQAKINARKAKISISQAEAEAQARQFALDQEFMNRARYVNQLDMARYQQYASAEAAIGLGQGMAQGGDGAAAAGIASGMALGAGMNYGARMPVPYPPPGYGPPGMPVPPYQAGQPGPPGYPPPYAVGPGAGYPGAGYPGAGYPGAPGYPPPAAPGAAPPAGARPGAAPGPAAPRCTACGAEYPRNARFCAECGRSVAP